MVAPMVTALTTTAARAERTEVVKVIDMIILLFCAGGQTAGDFG
jgi:hypothetical protein